uniref:Disease resistance N-terminal domain-containing protein n=1 Tax=Oryza glumipatula TaxID=40148 RepID=A0A0E0BJL8_9ORYZ
MEAAAVSASTGALNTLLPKLADLLLLVAGEHHSSRRAVEDGVEHLESELTSMRAALEKANKQWEDVDKQIESICSCG